MKAVYYELKETRPRAAVAEYLRDLIAQIEFGEFLLPTEGGLPYLDLPENMLLEVKVASKEKKAQGRKRFKIEVELKWSDPLLPEDMSDLEEEPFEVQETVQAEAKAMLQS
ncbi:MAG: amphi-Trp domain-containing protein [Ardenticatenaceae bacterium]|nr:amphi-Trp domain-containing protein [Ardenticatenaceae bacterium]